MDIRARILVVDDNVTMRESLRDTLAAETQRVLCVENAIQGIAELEKQEFDVVLADLSLPRRERPRAARPREEELALDRG